MKYKVPLDGDIHHACSEICQGENPVSLLSSWEKGTVQQQQDKHYWKFIPFCPSGQLLSHHAPFIWEKQNKKSLKHPVKIETWSQQSETEAYQDFRVLTRGSWKERKHLNRSGADARQRSTHLWTPLRTVVLTTLSSIS